MDLARRTAEQVARESYGRLVAMLAARTRDIASAEDAFAEAMVAALCTWPDRGIPANPDAWLLTAARNAMKNMHRHRGIAAAAEPELLAFFEAAVDDEAPPFPDERLKLLFVCAHPAIDPAIRTPLMLQTILGLDAARIANALLVAPATVGQRLVRAKAKIKEAGLRFEVPSADDMPYRLSEVLDAIYVAFGAGWEEIGGAETKVRGLVEEAIYLCRLLVSLLPREPEAQGLLALMLYCEARRGARRDAAGHFMPLDRQDASLWSRDMIIEAEILLTSASRFGQFGRYQCEAAIQSVHVQRPITGRTNQAALITLYRLLGEHAQSIGVSVGLAAVLLEAGRATEAEAVLDGLAAKDIKAYQPYWVTRAKVLAALGQRDDARSSLETAIGLTEDASIRAFLRGLID